MQSKTDYAAGIVPIYKSAVGWQVLLVHQISHRGDTFWIFPKGHAEGSETPAETAQRELHEETGIQAVELVTEPVFTMHYSFIHKQTRINKTVDYFIGYTATQATHISQPQEIKALAWCTLAEAKTRLSHQNTRDILAQVIRYLDDSAEEADTVDTVIR